MQHHRHALEGTVPRYDYRCSTCETVYELSRPMADADATATCPDGHQGAVRLLAVFATTSSAPTERTAPAPSGGGCCGGGCCS